MESQLVKCPGCGVVLPAQDSLPESPFHASAECWRLYSELASYTLTLGSSGFIHQTAIDTYEAQHAGGSAKSISTVFGLIGLYLVLEKGYTGKQAQEAHMVLGRQKRVYPQLVPPNIDWEVTVADVLAAPPGEVRDKKIRLWAACVWQGWHKDRQKIIDLVDKYLFTS